MKKYFEKPTVEIVNLGGIDIIRTSIAGPVDFENGENLVGGEKWW